MKQAVVLAGGKGTRLRTVIGDVPKPLADVGGTPLLGHQLRLLHHHGFGEAVLLVSHGADQIRDWLTNVPRSPIAVRLVDDGTPRGTAGDGKILRFHPYPHPPGALLPNLVLSDRDGTLNRDVGHLRLAEDLEVFPFVGPALRQLNSCSTVGIIRVASAQD
jgi:hypothetical protein